MDEKLFPLFPVGVRGGGGGGGSGYKWLEHYYGYDFIKHWQNEQSI